MFLVSQTCTTQQFKTSSFCCSIALLGITPTLWGWFPPPFLYTLSIRHRWKTAQPHLSSSGSNTGTLVTTDQQSVADHAQASWDRGRCQQVSIQSRFYRGWRNQDQFLLYEVWRKHCPWGRQVVCGVYLGCSPHLPVHGLYLLEWLGKSLHRAIQGATSAA